MSVVYVIGGDSLTDVKIGISTNPQQRLQQLQRQASARLSILWTTPGGHWLEQQLHARLHTHRTHGEWFDLTALGDPVTVVQEAVRALEAGPPCTAPNGCTEPDSCHGGPCFHTFRALMPPQ